MGQAKDAQTRVRVIEDWQSGKSYAQISVTHNLGYNTVRNWCHRYKSEKELGLIPRYKQCGRRSQSTLAASFRLVRLISYLHPDWGMDYIVCRIKQRFTDLSLLSPRQYQRLIQRRNSKVPEPTVPKTASSDRAREPHDTWQIDAKERIPLTGADGGEACFLNITDEKTSALLNTKAFSPGPH